MLTHCEKESADRIFYSTKQTTMVQIQKFPTVSIANPNLTGWGKEQSVAFA
jgi:hypothetical protein